MKIIIKRPGRMIEVRHESDPLIGPHVMVSRHREKREMADDRSIGNKIVRIELALQTAVINHIPCNDGERKGQSLHQRSKGRLFRGACSAVAESDKAELV